MPTASPSQPLDYSMLRHLHPDAGEIILAATDEQLLALRLEIHATHDSLVRLDNQVASTLLYELLGVSTVIDYEFQRRKGVF